jgi:lysophospholipase L1-like esterase
MFLVCSAFALLSFVPAKKKKVIFFGDSITQAGVGPEGYITQMKAILPADGYELIGAGIGGNKVYDLYLRMEDDVLNKQPDIVVIYIGVNDVWHKSSHGTGTDLDKFEKFYRALIKKIQANNAKIVLCTPAVIGEKKDGDNAQDADLNKFSNVIRKISEDTKLPLCDLRKLFMDYNLQHNAENNEKGILTSDRVHLNKEGNALVAKNLADIIAKL